MSTMTLDDEGHALIERHRQWWRREGALVSRVAGSPLGDLWLPLSDGTVATQDTDLTPDMLDVERIVGPVTPNGPLRTHALRFEIVAPFQRVPWVEAILGTPIRATIQGGSMRTSAFVDGWDAWHGVEAHLDQDWYDLLLHLTELLVARSGGRYAVVQPIMRGPSDIAEAVLGPELMSLSLYDHPDELRAFLDEVTNLFIDIHNALLARIPRVEGGVVSHFGIWAPGTVVRTQCDASAFLSSHHYAEWFLPYDVRISESTDDAIIHLHSTSLHTVDALLGVDKPDAIQITRETTPNAPSLETMVPILRKILAQKPLLLEGPLTDAELDFLLVNLPHDGLAITAWASGW